MKKHELNEIADDIRKDCIDKYIKALGRIFADKGCDKIITNYTGQLNSLELMSTITVKYIYKCGENIIIRWTNGINEVDSNFSQLSLGDACYLFDHVMKICDGVNEDKRVDVSFPGGIMFIVPYKECFDKKNVRDWLYNHFGEVMESNKDRIFRNVKVNCIHV